MSKWIKKKNKWKEPPAQAPLPACLPPVTVRFWILSSQMFNNSYTYIGGYLTHDRQTVRSSCEWCLGAPLTVKPIRESSPRHRSLAHHFTSLFDSRLPGEVSMCVFSMRTTFRNDKAAWIHTVRNVLQASEDVYVCVFVLVQHCGAVAN